MASPNGKKSVNRAAASKNAASNNVLDLLLFPPVILVPILIAALVTGGLMQPAAAFPSHVTYSVCLTFLALSLAFLTLRKKGHHKAYRAVALWADGLMLIFSSALFGLGDIFSWAGLALLAVGLFMSLTQLSPPPAARFAKISKDLLPESVTKTDIRKLIASIVFPTAFLETDEAGEERIVAANEPLAAILGSSVEGMEGAPFSTLMPPDMEERTLKFADAEWLSHRTTKGKQSLFMLSPSLQAPSEVQQAAVFGEIVDPESRLFTTAYMKYKAEADVQACIRHKRRLSVILLTLELNSGTVIIPSDETKNAAFAAFGQMISVSIRACDTAYRMGDEEVLIFLPDAGQAAAQNVVNRLSDNVRKLAIVESAELGNARLIDAAVDFFGDEIVSVDRVVQEVYMAMARRKK